MQLSYAKTVTTDQLLQVPLAGFFGYGNQWRNAGTVEGNTIEGSHRGAADQEADLLVEAPASSCDRSRNEITEFSPPASPRRPSRYRCTGASLHDMYGFQFLRDPANLPADVQARANQFVSERRRAAGVGRSRRQRQPQELHAG